MYILGFDTSNSYSSVSISFLSEIIYAKKDFEMNTQAERLIIMIEQALETTNLDYGKIDYIAASSGPGSFTGVRIALASSRGVIIGNSQIKPVCVNNFQLINFRVRQQVSGFDFLVASVNAYREQLYIQLFTKKGEYSEPKLLYLNEAEELIAKLNGTVVMAGSGLEKIYRATKMPPNGSILLPRFSYPDARFVCKVAHQHIVQSKANVNLEPLYIREPDAKLPSKL